MKQYTILTGVLAFCMSFFIIAVMGLYAEIKQERESQHHYLRVMELQVAEIKARLETLENIGVEINILDHSGLWMVTNANIEEK